VVNAVIDAVRQFGVQDIRMALTPERVWRAIHESGTAAGDADRATEGTVAYGGAQTGATAGGAQ
jgi:carbon-monoxide dehydrogenase large subunit